MSQDERDIRDVTRAVLETARMDTFYATLYPRPEPAQSPWGPVSILTDDEVTKIVLAYHLRRRYGIRGPAERADDFLRLVVSRRGIGREQAVKTHVGDVQRKASIWSKIWPFGGPKE